MYFCSMKKDWFVSWFDTDYYHTLYKHRDENEAKRFISNLCKQISLDDSAQVLDLACGKGRHSMTLQKLGFQVLGADLSPNSIALAQEAASENVEFRVHDMREIIPNKQFDAVFNLFTSFGYFDTTDDNLKVLSSIHAMLKPGGLLVLDFMNVQKVIAHLVPEETKEIDGLHFHIQRRFDGAHIFKHIEVVDQGESHHFTERVQALTLRDFTSILTTAHFKILHTFGDIELNPFEPEISDRLIIVAQKS